jgi:pilus assembly protein CpaE
MNRLENITIPRISIEAWYSHSDTAQAINEAANSRLLHRKRKVDVNRYDLTEITQRYTDNTTPELLILEIDGDSSTVLDALEAIARVSQMKTKVIVICQVNDVNFYKKLIDFDVSGYLLGPANTSELLDAIAQTFAPNGSSSRGRITAVIGAAGGVGSSTLAQNLAWNMAEVHGNQTLLVDGDIAFGSALLNFNQTSDKDIGDAMWADNVDETFLSNVMIPLGEKLELLPSPASLDRATNFADVQVEKVLDAIKHSSPNIVVDLPHEWGVLSNHTINEADDVIVVATPDIIGLRNTKTIMKHLSALRNDINATHYIINNSGIPKRIGVTEEEFQQAIGIPPLAVIPYEPQLFSAALAEGRPFSEMHEGTPIASQFSSIALKLTDGVPGTIIPDAVDLKPSGPKILSLLKGAATKRSARKDPVDLSSSGKKGGIFAALKLPVKRKSA